MREEIKLVNQPKHSRLCGQCVIAMILGVTLEEAIAMVGHRKGTTAPELRRVLREHGVSLLPTQLTAHHDIPDNAILRFSKPYGKNWHWLLKWEGKIFDSSGNFLYMMTHGWLITSFMEIQK